MGLDDFLLRSSLFFLEKKKEEEEVKKRRESWAGFFLAHPRHALGMAEEHDPDAVFPPPADFAAAAHVKSLDEYKAMYARSVEHPQAFWGEIAAQVRPRFSASHATGRVDTAGCRRTDRLRPQALPWHWTCTQPVQACGAPRAAHSLLRALTPLPALHALAPCSFTGTRSGPR